MLNELNFISSPSENGVWPRVSWVAADLMGLLPIHVAGYRGRGSTQNAFDRIVSSYIPTIEPLRYDREQGADATIHTF